MSKKTVRIFTSFKLQLIFGFIFLASFILLLVPISMQLGKHFSFSLFVPIFIFMSTSFASLFFFLRTILVPVLQIDQKEIMITRIKRFAIPLKDVKNIRVEATHVLVEFIKNGEVQQVKVSVEPGTLAHRIKDGKFQF